MRIGVISDTHGNILRINQALAQMGKIDALLHAGDFGEGFKALQFAFPVYYVKGNCDWTDFETPEELTINLGGIKILLTHGHRYGVKGRLNKLQYLAEQEGAKVVVFGHSHEPHQEINNDILFLNPGSISRPRTPMGPSYAMININENNVAAEIVPLKIT